MNKLHPSVNAALSARDKTALALMAWSLWSDDWTWVEPSGQMKIAHRGDFVEKMSAMLKVNAFLSDIA